MPSGIRLEHLIITCLVYVLLRLVWKQHRRRLEKLRKKVKQGPPRRCQPKSPKDCPACQAGVSLTLPRIRREVKPWSQVKSTRGRKKRIKTQGFACPNVRCAYFGVRDSARHALVGNGKRGKHKHIQTVRCQACKCSFSSRRNTPLYYLKTAPDRVEMCLWLLAKGVDISVLVRFTGHVDATVTRWLLRAGGHGERLHDVLFVDLQLAYIQVDELKAPIAGNRRTNWLWLGIDPLTKIVPALHIGNRKTDDAMQFVHQLVCHLAQNCVPAFTSDGLRQYFYALTAHFGHWKYSGKQWEWLISDALVYGQLIKRRNKRKSDKRPFTITRMMWGRRWQLFALLLELGFSATIQTAFIERLNLTIRQGVAPLARRTWSLARSNEYLLLHVHWWRTYYHFSRAHESLKERVPGFRRCYRQRTPAIATGLTHRIWSVGDSCTCHSCQKEVLARNTQPGRQPGSLRRTEIEIISPAGRGTELFALSGGKFCRKTAALPGSRAGGSAFPELSIVSSCTTANVPDKSPALCLLKNTSVFSNGCVKLTRFVLR